MPESPPPLIEHVVVKSVEDVFNYLLPDRGHWGDGRVPDWVFRGQDVDEPLLPSAWRPDVFNATSWGLQRSIAKEFAARWAARYAPQGKLLLEGIRGYMPVELNDLEKVERAKWLITQVRWEEMLVHRFQELADEVGIAVSSDWTSELTEIDGNEDDSFFANNPTDAYTFAQHHGVPTRLLDWTRKSLVALYFAAEKALLRNAPIKSEEKIVVWALNVRETKKLLVPQTEQFLDFRTKVLGLDILPGRRAGHSFLQAQDGLFTGVHAWEIQFLKDGRLPTLDQTVALVTTKKPATFFRKLSIAGDQAKQILEALQRFRVTRYHLMPTLDNIARVMREMEPLLPPKAGQFIPAAHPLK